MVVAVVDGIEKEMKVNNQITQINKNALKVLRLPYENVINRNIFNIIDKEKNYLDFSENVYNKELHVSEKISIH